MLFMSTKSKGVMEMKLTAFLCLLCSAAAIPSTPSTDPDDYGLFRAIPDGCDAATTRCIYFSGLRVNEGDSSYLDVYLSANDTGWVAIGFSVSNSMRESDVVGCVVEQGTMEVVAIDTYNVPQLPNDNLLDVASAWDRGYKQDDIMQGSGSLDEGRITCTFSRQIVGNDEPPLDFNLDDDYFFLFGFNTDPRSSPTAGFSTHGFGPGEIPTILGMFNPVRDVGQLPIVGSGSGSAGIVAPTLAPADYRLRRRDPPNCDPEDCDYFMGINTNSNDDYLDFYMTGVISGWVAVGFSHSANMFDADVVGCNLDALSQTVFSVDTYDTVSTPRDNNRDSDDTDFVRHNSSFEDGRITCIFSRRIIGASESPEDQPLNRDYYFLFGLGETGGGDSSFPDHGHDNQPVISDGRFDPSTDEGDIEIGLLRQQLLQAHGILMLIAWPVLAFTAIFFAVYMKQALPNGEWFQVHRAFHIAALFVAVIGFILAFVANKDGNPRGLINLGSTNKVGTAHFVLGIIIMALQIANPIISIFRCKPKGEHRWIFNLIHGSMIGLGVEFLAYANIGIGVSIFSETESDFGDLTIFWVYLAFVVAAIILNSALLLYFTCEAATKGEEGTKLAPAVVKPFFSKIFGDSSKSAPPAVEMTKAGEPAPHGPPPKKTPASDSPIRWIGLGLFLGLMIPLILAVIVMIAATGSQD